MTHRTIQSRHTLLLIKMKTVSCRRRRRTASSKAASSRKKKIPLKNVSPLDGTKEEEVVWFSNPSKQAARARREKAKDTMGRELWYNIMADSSDDEGAEEKFYFYEGVWHSCPQPQPEVVEVKTETFSNVGLLNDIAGIELLDMGPGEYDIIAGKDRLVAEDLLFQFQSIDAVVEQVLSDEHDEEGATVEWFSDPSKDAARARRERAKAHMGSELWNKLMQDSDSDDDDETNDQRSGFVEETSCAGSSAIQENVVVPHQAMDQSIATAAADSELCKRDEPAHELNVMDDPTKEHADEHSAGTYPWFSGPSKEVTTVVVLQQTQESHCLLSAEARTSSTTTMERKRGWASRVGRKFRGWAARVRRALTPSCIINHP